MPMRVSSASSVRSAASRAVGIGSSARRLASTAPRAAQSNQPPSASACGEHALELRRGRGDAALGAAKRSGSVSASMAASSSLVGVGAVGHARDNSVAVTVNADRASRTAPAAPARSAAASSADRSRALPRHGRPRRARRAGDRDDAGVYRLSDDLALVQTVDFFTPIVDDPYDFGRIAATNALSDVYAMGGAAGDRAQPRRVLARASSAPRCWREILRGGADVAARGRRRRSSAATRSTTASPSTGMAVTGTCIPTRLVRNSTARPATCSFLTKPIGAGAVTTAAKRGIAAPRRSRPRVDGDDDAERGRRGGRALAAGAHAMTDVTGFGLLGHLHELAPGERRRRGGGRRRRAGDRGRARAARRRGSDRRRQPPQRRGGGYVRLQRRRRAALTRRLVSDPMTWGGLLVALPASGPPASPAR